MSSAIEVLEKIKREDMCVQLPAISQEKHNEERRIAWEERQRTYDEAIVALKQKEKLEQEVTYQLDQLIYTDKTKENIRRSVWKEVLELLQ